MEARPGPESMGRSPLQPLSGTGCSCPEARPGLSSLITNWAPSRPCLLSAARCPWRPAWRGHVPGWAHAGGRGPPSPSRSLSARLCRHSHLPPLHPDQQLGSKDGGTQISLDNPSGKQRTGCSSRPNPLSVDSTPGPSGSSHSSTQSANRMGLSHPQSCPCLAQGPWQRGGGFVWLLQDGVLRKNPLVRAP